MPTLAYYITAHGYGHGVRSCDIIRALRAARPDLEVVVVSDLPPAFLRSRLPADGVHLRTASFDLGMVQLDSIRVDVPETLRRLRACFADRPARVAAEADWLAAQGIRRVAADIPSMPLEAAARAGLPAIAVGNFAWDWIYDEFADRDPGWCAVADAVRAGYAQADLLVRLPFAEEMTAFPRRVDVPLVSLPGTPRRADLARRYGCDPGLTWVLLSFTTLDWDDEALRRVAALDDCLFFTVKPLAWAGPRFVAVEREDFAFGDVLASCDLVVTKPGYGILSECVVNDKPIVYAERTDFREYPVLERALQRHLRHVHLPAEQLYRGDLAAAVAAARSAPPAREPLAADGGVAAAAWVAGDRD